MKSCAINSSIGWHESQNDYLPFIHYYLGIAIKAYKKFQDRVEHLHYRTVLKADRIKAVSDKKLGKITKVEIILFCPDIGQTTIERALNELVSNVYNIPAFF